ncbi:MAG TPA: hypothetical protein DCW31_06430 [Lactobacillus sp.]|nr:hypothetical protein [Lactobacillus sp.]
MSKLHFSGARLRDQTIDLQNQTFANSLWEERQIVDDFEVSLTTTLFVQPVQVRHDRLTLVLDHRLGPLLVRRSSQTLMRELMMKNSRTHQLMNVAHHFLGQHQYVPYVKGQYGFVPTAGASTSVAGWLGFYRLRQFRRIGADALLIFDNNMKLILPLSYHFVRQRLIAAASVAQLQKEELELLVENSGFDKQRPVFNNKLAKVLGLRPVQVLRDETEFYVHIVEVLMAAGIEDFLEDGYGNLLNLDRETLAREVRHYLKGRGRYILPKKRHFALFDE